MTPSRLVSLCAVAAALAACGDTATLPLAAEPGRRPQLPPPRASLLPTVHIAPAKGWPAGDKPVAAPGLASPPTPPASTIRAGCTCLPNGDVLVAETNAPPKPEDERACAAG
jgi:hypothetical protein